MDLSYVVTHTSQIPEGLLAAITLSFLFGQLHSLYAFLRGQVGGKGLGYWYLKPPVSSIHSGLEHYVSSNHGGLQRHVCFVHSSLFKH